MWTIHCVEMFISSLKLNTLKNTVEYLKAVFISISASHASLTSELFALQTSSPNSSNENSPVSPPDDQGQGDSPTPLEEEEPAFPHTELAKLDDMINRLGLLFYIWSNGVCVIE